MEQVARAAGIQDVPITGKLLDNGTFEGDTLDMRRYASALATFVQECETPLTIAIQGDWGSGKSSLMNMLEQKLGESAVIPIKFNTWRHSQFDLADQVAVSMINHFIEKIWEGMPDVSLADQVSKGVRGLARSAWNLVPSIVSGTAKTVDAVSPVPIGEKVGEMAGEWLSSKIKVIGSLQDSLKKMVEERLRRDLRKRIVFFIDDLDRLKPAKAVELLEVTKIFLDMKQCVFIFACDFEIIKRGVKGKFGLKDSELAGRSFFDKIFQLSFNMPVGAYNLKSYVNGLIEPLGWNESDNDIDEYLELLQWSIGFNPRKVKRLVNSLALLDKVQESRTTAKGDEQAVKHHRKVLFGVGCMEAAYQPLYQLVLRRLNDKPVRLLQEELASEDSILKLEALQPLFAESADKDQLASRIWRFVGVFVGLLDTDGDGLISLNEIERLRRVFSETSLTNVVLGQDQTDVGSGSKDYFSQFVVAVTDELGKMGLGSMLPRGHNRQVREGQDGRQYDLWHKSSAFGSLAGLAGYRISIKPEYEDMLGLKFYCDKGSLENRGVARECITKLCSLALVTSGEFRYSEAQAWAGVSREYPSFDVAIKGEVNASGAQKVAEDLKRLIDETYKTLDLSSKPPSGS